MLIFHFAIVSLLGARRICPTGWRSTASKHRSNYKWSTSVGVKIGTEWGPRSSSRSVFEEKWLNSMVYGCL